MRSMAGIAALAAIGSIPALAADVTFAQYIQTNGSAQEWSVSTSGGVTTVHATGAVLFQFSSVPGLPFSGPEAATFTLNATSAQVGNCGVACGPGDSFVQPGYSGTFSFVDAGIAPGTNLLSGIFAVTGSPSTTGAQFSSSVGGSGASFNASATPGNLNQLIMSSAYINFIGQTQETASWSISSLNPNFATGTVTANQSFPGPTFTGSGSGTFSSNPGPVAATPEPGTVLMLGGGLIALSQLRRRKRFEP